MSLSFSDVAIVISNYDAKTAKELFVRRNDIVYVLERAGDWCRVKLRTRDPIQTFIGLVPFDSIEIIHPIGTATSLCNWREENGGPTGKQGDVVTLYQYDEEWAMIGNGFDIAIIPRNVVKISVAQEGHAQEYQAEAKHQPEKPTLPRSNTPVGPHGGQNDIETWTVKMIGKKNIKGCLGINNTFIFFGSEKDKSPVRQWSIKDVDRVRHEKSHVYLDLGGTSPVSLDFQAASAQDAMAISNKIQGSKQRSRIPRPVAPTSSVLVSHLMSASTCLTAEVSLNASAAYIAHHEPEPVEEGPAYEEERPHTEPEPESEGRWAIALYDFQAETEEELTIKENDELWVLDHAHCEGWWTVQLDDQVGFVPASYVEFVDEPAPEEQVEGSEAVSFEDEEPEVVEIHFLVPPSFFPITTSTPKAVEPVKEEVLAAPTPASTTTPASAVKKPKNTRVWTSRSGMYNVEAEYLGFHDGKICLHKKNGVKIAVPLHLMSQRDIFYVEKATGMKISESESDWFSFFIKAGIATDDALRYSTAFRQEKIDETTLPHLDRSALKDLKIKEGDIVRIRMVTGVRDSGSPLRELSQEDIFYREKTTDMKTSESDSEWLNFFTKAGIAAEDALRYSVAFRQEKIDWNILPDLDREALKDLQVKVGDITRIQKVTRALASEPSIPSSAPAPAATEPTEHARFVESEAELQQSEHVESVAELQGCESAPSSRTPIVFGMENNSPRDFRRELTTTLLTRMSSESPLIVVFA
ncbi:cytoskeletal protein binding protein [Mortierella sp. NVP85]|nr:cytoskeletal protein binding protein [Mortierella sp. NVP85]